MTTLAHMRAAVLLLALLPACGGIAPGSAELFESTEELQKQPKNPDPARGCVLDPGVVGVCTDTWCANGCPPGEVGWACGGSAHTPLGQSSCVPGAALGAGSYWCCPFVSAAE